MGLTDKERTRLWEFTYEVLDDAESELKETFEDNPYVEETMHMNMVDALSFRLLCEGWEKEQLKRWMGERVDFLHKTIVEIERKEQGRSFSSLH